MSTIGLLSGRQDWLARIEQCICDKGQGDFEVLVLALPMSEGRLKPHAVVVDLTWLSEQQRATCSMVEQLLVETPFIAIEDGDTEKESLPFLAQAREVFSLAALTPEWLRCTMKLLIQNTHLKTELDEIDKRYLSLFSNAVDAAFFLDGQWRISRVNEAFCQTFGGVAKDYVGEPFSKVFYENSDFKRIKSSFSDAQRSHIDEECLFKFLDRKGRFLGHIKISSLQEHSRARANDDVMTHFQGFLSNISYRERLRKIKERADRVDMTYRLAQTLAHEIRNPLTNINLALEHIDDRKSEDTTSKPMLDIIKRAASRINSLIDQLLTSSERSHLHIEHCHIEELLGEVARSYKDRAGMVNAQIRTDFEASATLYPCDIQKIKLAISNLVSNAIEALSTNEGLITIGTYTEEGYYMIYVEDNGRGMTDEIKQSLFDPFFTRKDGGVGLGLTSAQTIIAEHEGEIEVESEPDLGSTFTISLPLKDNQNSVSG